MGADDVVHFTVTRENEPSDAGAATSRTFVLKLGQETPIRIGRAPANDVIVDSRGVSQYHCELRVLQLEGADGPQLCIRDLSMNGTGLKQPGGNGTVHLEKQSDTAVPNGSTLYVPMMLKQSAPQSDRAHLKVEYQESAGNGAAAQQRKRSSKKRKAAAASEEVRGSGGSGAADDTAQAEAKRMRFVELLLNTKEVSAGTTFEEAEELLSSKPDWYAVDATTREECFSIFVEHLGTHSGGKKKQKKKEKGKEKEKDNKEKSKKAKKDEGAGREEKKRHKSKSRDRTGKHKRSKRGKAQGSDASGSPVKEKSRRRDHSS